jgi:hypothetical protein
VAEKRDGPPSWWESSGPIDESNQTKAPTPLDELTRPELELPRHSFDEVTDPDRAGPPAHVEEKTVPVDITAFGSGKPPPQIAPPVAAPVAPAPWLPKAATPPAPVAPASPSQRSPAASPSTRPAPPPRPAPAYTPRVSTGPLSRLSDDTLQTGLIVVAVLIGVIAIALIIGVVLAM